MITQLQTVDYERIALSLTLISVVFAAMLYVVVRFLTRRARPELDRQHEDARDLVHTVRNLEQVSQMQLPHMRQRLDDVERTVQMVRADLGAMRDGIARSERMLDILTSHLLEREGNGAAGGEGAGSGR